MTMAPSPSSAADSPLPPPARSFARETFAALAASPVARACALVLLLFFLAAVAALAADAFYAARDVTPPWQLQDLAARHLPPSRAHLLGTDALGRSVALRLAQGAGIAFEVGVVSSLIAIPLGLLLGLLGGYFGGKTDDVVTWLTTTFASIPGLLFVLAIAMVVGKGLLGVFLAIGLTSWVSTCRLVRAETIRQRQRGYVRAAEALGFSAPRILFRHILPNVVHVAIVSFTLRFPSAIGTEVFLSFLGIGAQGKPSWGVMISDARLRLWQGCWWELASVSLAIFLVVLAFKLLGDLLRDALDPRLHSRPD